MQQIIITVGIVASAKSTWAIAKVAKDPHNWIRINKDSLRIMLNNYIWSTTNEKLIHNIGNNILIL